ncbi:MAG: hypothetical protein AAF430_04915 [Myxococcota bacterium]
MPRVHRNDRERREQLDRRDGFDRLEQEGLDPRTSDRSIERRADVGGDVWRSTSGASTAPHCAVCGSHRVTLDEVDVSPAANEAHVLLLGACDHCDHRWTEAYARPLVRSVRTVRAGTTPLSEVASAA